MTIYSLGERVPRFATSRWYVAPGARLIGSVTLEDEASLWFNVVARSDREVIVVGERSNVQDGSVLHADPERPLLIGREVSVGHNATLHGCRIGEGTLIGMNAVILNNARIGAGCIVGAGALIPEGKAFPDGMLILGAPGKVVREISDEERLWIRGIAEGYVRRSEHYRRALVPLQAPPADLD